MSHSGSPLQCRHMSATTTKVPSQSASCMERILTHWGRVTHICVGNLTIIGSDNGLSPDRRQAITRTNVGILLIGLLWTNFSEMLIEIHIFSFKKIHLKMSSGKWQPFRLGCNALMPRHHHVFSLLKINLKTFVQYHIPDMKHDFK